MIFPIFPVGATQTLTLGDLTLTLDWPDFNGDGDAGDLGYQRIEDPTQQITATESIYGASILDGPQFSPLHIFRWSLNLPIAKVMLLKALWQEQQSRFKLHQDGRILLLDKRLAYMDRLPRSHAWIGGAISDPEPPPGFTFYWGQFYILLEIGTDFDVIWGKPSGEDLRYEVAIAARSLGPVPVTEDIEPMTP